MLIMMIMVILNVMIHNGDVDCDGDIDRDGDDGIISLFNTIRIEQGILWIQRWWIWGNTLRQ